MNQEKKIMRKLKKISIAIQAIVGLLLAAAAIGVAATPTLTTLQPGQFREINQNLTINIVFVGYRPGTGPRDIDETLLRGELPQVYKAINRIPNFVGLQGSQAQTGVSFTYSYNIVYANSSFEDAFF